jgi:hypothetical protein
MIFSSELVSIHKRRVSALDRTGALVHGAIYPNQITGGGGLRGNRGHFLRFSLAAGVTKRAANSSVEVDAVE